MFYLLHKGNQMLIGHARFPDAHKITDFLPYQCWHPLCQFCIILNRVRDQAAGLGEPLEAEILIVLYISLLL